VPHLVNEHLQPSLPHGTVVPSPLLLLALLPLTKYHCSHLLPHHRIRDRPSHLVVSTSNICLQTSSQQAAAPQDHRPVMPMSRHLVPRSLQAACALWRRQLIIDVCSTNTVPRHLYPCNNARPSAYKLSTRTEKVGPAGNPFAFVCVFAKS
jgi:hypothetical protein